MSLAIDKSQAFYAALPLSQARPDPLWASRNANQREWRALQPPQKNLRADQSGRTISC